MNYPETVKEAIAQITDPNILELIGQIAGIPKVVEADPDEIEGARLAEGFIILRGILYLINNSDVVSGLKEGDLLLCDDRNNIHERHRPSIQMFDHYTNGWINTKEEVGVGHNPLWTSKLICTNIRLTSHL